MAKLTNRQEKFAVEYLKTFNATQSAIKAGYSENTARVSGSRLLHTDKVKDFINEHKEKMINEDILQANAVLYLLSRTAVGETMDTRAFVLRKGEFMENPTTKKSEIVYNDHIEKIEVPAKLSDRNRALELLGKYHALYTDKKEIQGDTPILISIGEWDEEEEKQIDNTYPNATKILDDIPDND